MKSFQAQLQSLFKNLCYISSGIRINPSIELQASKDSSSLPSFRITIAKSLYDYHRRDNFRFADKGTTPVALAEEILAHYGQKTLKQHIDLQIDSFGNFIARPTESYIDGFRQAIMRDGRFGHLAINGIPDVQASQETLIIFEPGSKSCDQFRICMYLECIGRKIRLLRQGSIRKFLSIKPITDSIKKSTMQSSIMQIPSEINIFDYFNDQEVYHSDTTVETFMQKHAADKVIIGCPSHHRLKYQAVTKLVQDCQLLSFGQVIPNFSVKATSPASLQGLSTLRTLIMRCPRRYPINLNKLTKTEPLQSTLNTGDCNQPSLLLRLSEQIYRNELEMAVLTCKQLRKTSNKRICESVEQTMKEILNNQYSY